MKHVVAVVAVIVRGSQVLAMRRASHKVGAGLWETVSGRVEIGEDPRSTAAREIAEETKLRVRLSPQPVDAYSARRGDDPMVVIVYRADTVDAEVHRSDEHDAHAWLSLDEFRQRCTLGRLVEAVERAVTQGAVDKLA